MLSLETIFKTDSLSLAYSKDNPLVFLHPLTSCWVSYGLQASSILWLSLKEHWHELWRLANGSNYWNLNFPNSGRRCRSIMSHDEIPRTKKISFTELLADEILKLSDPEYSLLIRQQLLSQQVPWCYCGESKYNWDLRSPGSAPRV